MDERIKDILAHEKARQAKDIQLIASENFASPEVMCLCGSEFANKYAEGYPGKRYYNGCAINDAIESLAIDLVKELYGAAFANVQPHCGANANTAVYQALLKPGDTILGMDLSSGGHLSHGAKVNMSGKVYKSHVYGVDDHGFIDYYEVRQIALTVRPQLIIAGASAYSRVIDWKRFKDIASEVGAFLLADMSHYSGLIAGGCYPNPVPHADIVTSTTHKTLRGPRGGIILWNDPKFSQRINSAIFPGTQGGPHMNNIAAKAQCFAEALRPEFAAYAQGVVENARAMCDVFIENGYKVQSYGTDSHLLLLRMKEKKKEKEEKEEREKDVNQRNEMSEEERYSKKNRVNTVSTGREAANLLENHGIVVNKNGVPNDTRNFLETSGIRIGTAAETTRGHSREWFVRLAERIVQILEGFEL